ncbi:MAG: MaoC family dehydratase [Hyphomicrobiales bacterium]|uniref:MaoC family dehydratase n=1 Tax=Rhabdaerophilum calidifontis TaxID=2604328 RepID=UPI00123C5168|nr:MaoC family dehydratase [Rhabdaerophilum calidifontis]MCA1951699.1 MaoC family dehydratase [Hyphomicrobiales bacterium]MCA1998867.1 MaoC family dehydratase [Hyphomicrobiales bacterium]
MRAFEDFAPGTRESYGVAVIEAGEMLAFAREFDPQPMHLDADSEQARLMGGLIASGWFTAARNMRLMADHFILRSTGLGSPGVSSLKWLAPVRAGDRLSGTMEVLGRRASASKPDRGFVEFRFDLVNQDGVRVLEQINLIMFGRRDPGTPEAASEGSRIPPPPAEAFTATPTPGAERPGMIEDIAPGTVLRFGEYAFTREAMLRFATAYDPQPFHLDEAAGRASHFGGLSASGWHTAAAWMGTVIRFWQQAEAGGHRLPRRGPGFGFTDLVWRRPVLLGDTLTYYARILEARRSASKPGWGILTQRNYALNQRGEAVFAFTGSVLWEARS